MTRAQYQAKYGSAPSVPSAPAQMTRAQYQAKYGAPPTTEHGALDLQDISHGAAKGAIKGALETGSALTKLGGVIESGLDQTLGRGINAIKGKGFTPTNSSGAATQGVNTIDKLTNSPALASKNSGEGVGNVIGQGADLLVSPPGTLAEKGLQKGIGTASEIGAKISEKKSAAALLDMVSPKLTSKETAEALATRGGTKRGILGTVKLNTDPYVQKVADTVKKYVPDFSTKKSMVENINATKKAVSGLATDLKSKVVASGKDIIYPFKELASRMNAVEKPISLQADSTLSRKFDLAQQAALKIAKDSGGKISDLLEARKGFDDLVEKEFPTLYDRENAPMRSAITAMRRVMNDFIAEKLPDVAFKDSLKTQSDLLEAIGNMSEKAAKDVGTNIIQRGSTFAKEHPIAAKVGGGALIGLGVGGGMNIPKLFGGQ